MQEVHVLACTSLTCQSSPALSFRMRAGDDRHVRLFMYMGESFYGVIISCYKLIIKFSKQLENQLPTTKDHSFQIITVNVCSIKKLYQVRSSCTVIYLAVILSRNTHLHEGFLTTSGPLHFFLRCRSDVLLRGIQWISRDGTKDYIIL